MDRRNLKADAWTLVRCASRVCKPLLWMHDSDSPQRLVPKLKKPLKEALTTVVQLPDALSALRDKMCSIYDTAVSKPLVGIGASPFAGRLGERTAREGLMAALDFAKKRKPDFTAQASEVCGAARPDWRNLFRLTEEFIDPSTGGHSCSITPVGRQHA